MPDKKALAERKVLYNHSYSFGHYGILVRSLAIMLQTKHQTDPENIESLDYFAYSTLGSYPIWKCWLNEKCSIISATILVTVASRYDHSLSCYRQKIGQTSRILDHFIILLIAH